MSLYNLSNSVTDEIKNCLLKTDENSTLRLVKMIIDANSIFVDGRGRSRLMVQSFAMRLMQLGLKSYVVGETVTPAAEKNDLVLIASGSGETGTLVFTAEKIHDWKIPLAVITIYPNSSIAKCADLVVCLHGVTAKGVATTEDVSKQMSGNLFEQSLLIYLDIVTTLIAEKKNISTDNASMMMRHANIE